MVGYILKKCDRIFKTKLLKLLFYCDFLHYRNFGVSITGIVYLKLQHGPAPYRFDRLLTHLEERQSVEISLVTFPNGTEGQEILNRDEPAFDLLSQAEMSIIDSVLGQLGNLTVGQLSDLSHKEEGYIAADMSEPISFRYAEKLRIK